VSVRDYKKIGLDSNEQSKMQEYVGAVLTPIIRCPLIDGIHLKGVVLSNGTTNVDHLLGRAPLGWIITRQNAAAQIYEPSNASNKTKLLQLTSDAVVTIDLWVF
jgi:hypothetical protein